MSKIQDKTTQQRTAANTRLLRAAAGEFSHDVHRLEMDGDRVRLSRQRLTVSNEVFTELMG